MIRTRITAGFWHDRQEVNAGTAIFHQWDQLEASGCIENFRISSGETDGFREGWFFADSDAYKWLEAASRIYATHPDTRLAALMDELIILLAKAQTSDGYLYTYNQIHFPKVRWQNLQIEHELYCLGHLIEAGISHREATGRTDLFDISLRAADCIVQEFIGKGAEFTPGHEEIEIALLRLHQVMPGDTVYLELARQFLEKRGRSSLFSLSIFRQNASSSRRGKIVQRKKQEYLSAHPEFKPYQLPPGNVTSRPPFTTLRWFASALSGKYFQQHAPVRQQSIPVGHAVRFAYLETALAMLSRETGDDSLLPALERSWEHMLTRRMYVTGGIGSLPGLEGFGNDYELSPEYAYAETCAALGSLFWNWQMAQLTCKAQYSDLLEWQLYNASAVGMGLDGSTYLYNNPLSCHGEVTRKAWYEIPCCPSNISRTWADLGKYILSSNEKGLFIHQFISSENMLDAGNPVKLRIDSELPWNGKVSIRIDPAGGGKFNLSLRNPSWSRDTRLEIHRSDGTIDPIEIGAQSPDISEMENHPVEVIHQPASGFDPRTSRFISINRTWSSADILEINLDMSIQMRHARSQVKGHQGKITLTRGPLVYCLESSDNPGVDIFRAKIDTSSLHPVFDGSLLGGIMKIEGRTSDGHPITFIPYHLWGNRGPSQMNVWVKI